MCSHHVYDRLGYICDQQVHGRLSPLPWYCCGYLGNAVSGFVPTQFNKNSQKLERVQGKGYKFQHGKFKLDITRQTVQHWNRAVVECPSFDDFKALQQNH